MLGCRVCAYLRATAPASLVAEHAWLGRRHALSMTCGGGNVARRKTCAACAHAQHLPPLRHLPGFSACAPCRVPLFSGGIYLQVPA